jgi:Mn2+/Fe2+ NRAMP family transporter
MPKSAVLYREKRRYRSAKKRSLKFFGEAREMLLSVKIFSVILKTKKTQKWRNEVEILTILISVLGSVISGMTLFFLQKQLKKREEKDEERDKAKARENILILKSINAVGKLTEATAIAVASGKTNGEMHSALEGYGSIEREMYDYLLEQNANK